jgi:sterol O-acyltransferase
MEMLANLRNCSESFADRQFYEDWVCNSSFVEFHSYVIQWNSTSWDEFARKWNKPVYTFLLRHVYRATRKSYRISKSGAMFVTFLLSALAHELVMVIVTKKIRSISVRRGVLHYSEINLGCISLYFRSAHFFLPIR